MCKTMYVVMWEDFDDWVIDSMWHSESRAIEKKNELNKREEEALHPCPYWTVYEIVVGDDDG